MPERLDRFMARANAAYYATHDPFRDFTTGPEIAQVFGELLGAWAAVVWRQMGAPDPVLLVEAGPGRGTLMADLLRTIERIAPSFGTAIRLHCIETSQRLRAEQARRDIPAQWHDRIEDVPSGPMILIANEFLDALPIRQFVRREEGWCERHVEAAQFVDLPAPGMAFPGDQGTVSELADAALGWVTTLSGRLVLQGGAALILDYGAERGGGDTLQALRDGRPADPLTDPGTADLTAHVDFAAVGHTAARAGAAVWGPIPQGAFLEAIGLTQRTQRLAAANPARAKTLLDAAVRLASPALMGDLFLAMCLTHKTAPCPPGFEGAAP